MRCACAFVPSQVLSERPLACHTLRLDLAYTLRTWRRQPGTTATAILALALGIGANTTVFSFVAGVPYVQCRPSNSAVRNVARPSGFVALQDAMSREAQASCEKRARIILAAAAMGQARLKADAAPPIDGAA